MTTHESIRHSLLAAMARILRPLVRIAIKNGVMHTEFSREVRAAYLEVARESAIASGRTPTEMRLRLMTGLSSSDISQFRDSPARANGNDGPQVHNLVASVLSAWHNEPDYTFMYGVPAELPVRALPGRPSIAGLVAKFDPSADPNFVIEELMLAGCIRAVGEDRYVVLSRVYMPTSLSEASIRYFAEASERFLNTVGHNLTVHKDAAKLMERAVFADFGIPEHRLEDFKAFVKDQWSRFADPIDDYMNSPHGPGTETGPVVQTGVGVYHYVSLAQLGTETRHNDNDGEGKGYES